MGDYKVNKTVEQINKKIADGEAVVVTAEEIIGIVKKESGIFKISVLNFVSLI